MKDIITLLVILIVLIVITLYFIWVHIIKKRISDAGNRVDFAFDNINLYLYDKKELINKSREMLDDDYKASFDGINFDNYNFNELMSSLNDFNKKFDDELIDNDNYLKDENIYNLNSEIKDNNSCIDAALKFYNDSLNKYYDLKKKCHGVRIFCRFKDYPSLDIKETSAS